MKKGRPRTAQTYKKDESKSLLYWIISAVVVLFLVISPYYKALFNGGVWHFEEPIYNAVLSSAIVFFVLIFYVHKNKGQLNRGDILCLIIWLLPLSYLVSIVNAASYHSAINSVYIYSMYAIFFSIGLYITKNKLGLTLFAHAIVGTGYIIVIYGFMNWFGNAHMYDAVYGGRMANVFQYPNTYAAFLIAIIYASQLIMLYSKKWYAFLIHAFMQVPLLLSFLLTSSRGAILVMIFVLFIYLLILPAARQILSLIGLVAAGVGSFLILARITNIGANLHEGNNSALSLGGWAIVLSVSLIVSLFIMISQKHIGRWLENRSKRGNEFKLQNVLIPLFVLLSMILGLILIYNNTGIVSLLPETFRLRIINFSSGDSSFLSRAGYYSDAFELIKDHPVFGAGGGAWSNLYQVYQSYAYTSTQAHNFFLQYAVEVGLFGLIIFIILLVYLLGSFVKYCNSVRGQDYQHERLIFFIVAVSILLHSVIDFDMSFVYLGVLVFFCLGGMSSFPSKSETFKEGIQGKRWYKTIPIALAFVSILIIFFSARAVLGNNSYKSAIQESQSGDYKRITEKLDKALDYQGSNPEFVLTKVSLLSQAYEQTRDEKYWIEAQNRILQLEKNEPYNHRVFNTKYSLFILKGDLQQAYEMAYTKIKMFPWEITLYEKLIYLQFEMGYMQQQKGLVDKANENWDRALSIYGDMLKRIEWIGTLSEGQQYESYNFRVTPVIALKLGQIYYMKDEYKKASDILMLGRVSNDFKIQVNKDIVRWYLAAIYKQDLEDKELYDLLMAEDKLEDLKIKEIVEMRS